MACSDTKPQRARVAAPCACWLLTPMNTNTHQMHAERVRKGYCGSSAKRNGFGLAMAQVYRPTARRLDADSRKLGGDAGGHFIVDRADLLSHLLGGDALLALAAQEDHFFFRLQVWQVRYVHREHVHRDTP